MTGLGTSHRSLPTGGKAIRSYYPVAILTTCAGLANREIGASRAES